jgi:ArsR family transcriptional regulator
MDADLCDVTLVDKNRVREALERTPPETTIQHLGEFFKVIGDTTRLKIILALSRGELCVCDLAAVIGVSPSAVSHQLRLLRGARLVKFRREGKTVFYSLDDLHVERLLEDALDHLEEK